MPAITVGNAGLTADDSAGGVQTLSVTLTSAQATGDLIVILINYDPSLTLFSGFPQDTSANAFTQAGTTVSNADYKQEIWYCLSAKSASASANAVSVKLSATGAQGNFSVRVYTFQAPNLRWKFDQFSHTSSTGTTVTSGTVTTTSLNEVLVGKSGVQNSVTGGAGGSWVTATNDGLGDSAEYLIATSIQTNVAATFTQVSGIFVCSMATFAALAALEEYVPTSPGGPTWLPAMPLILAMDEELAQAPPPTLVDEEYAPGAWATATLLSAALLSVDEEFVQQPVLALEELQPWAPALPLVLGAPAPVTDEELPQTPPPPGAAFEEYAPPPLLFALGPWTMPWLVDEELAQPPPPSLVDEEYAPPLPPLFAMAPPVLFAFDEEVAWQQVFEDYLPPLVFPAIVWAQSGAFYEQEFAQAPTTVAIEEYAPGQQVAAPLVAAPPFAVFPLDQEFVQFVPPIVGSVVVDSIGVGHYIGLGHV